MFKFEDIHLIELPDERLREKSQDLKLPLSEEDKNLIEKMIFHVNDSQEPETKFRPAVGVAAVQYGILKNVFYILIKDDNDKVHHLPECDEQEGEWGTHDLRADAAEAVEDVHKLILDEVGIRENGKLLQALTDGRQLRDKPLEGRKDGARDDACECGEHEDEGDDGDCRRNRARHPPRLHEVHDRL